MDPFQNEVVFQMHGFELVFITVLNTFPFMTISEILRQAAYLRAMASLSVAFKVTFYSIDSY